MKQTIIMILFLSLILLGSPTRLSIRKTNGDNSHENLSVDSQPGSISNNNEMDKMNSPTVFTEESQENGEYDDEEEMEESKEEGEEDEDSLVVEHRPTYIVNPGEITSEQNNERSNENAPRTNENLHENVESTAGEKENVQVTADENQSRQENGDSGIEQITPNQATSGGEDIIQQPYKSDEAEIIYVDEHELAKLNPDEYTVVEEAPKESGVSEDEFTYYNPLLYDFIDTSENWCWQPCYCSHPNLKSPLRKLNVCWCWFPCWCWYYGEQVSNGTPLSADLSGLSTEPPVPNVPVPTVPPSF
jgi:hypothetical protein